MGPSSHNPERMEMKKVRKIKEKRARVRSLLNCGTATTSVTSIDAQKTLNHKITK